MDSKDKFQTVDEYICLQDKNIRPTLTKLREVIRKAAPNAEEGIGYGMPAYKLHGPLAYFAAYKNHYALYAMPVATAAFKERLQKYKTSKGTIQFPIDEPVPVTLVADIIKFRVQENLEKAASKEMIKKKK